MTMAAKAKKNTASEIALASVMRALIEACKDGATDETKTAFSSLHTKYLKQELAKHPLAEHYNILCLLDNTTLVKNDADALYQAMTSFPNNGRPLLLVLVSRGGEPEPAYLIGKLCREHSNGKFIVVVPRHAKSAATLAACAADEIHMGSLSELGPIDPQIDGKPALGLKNSVDHIAELVEKHRGAAEMFARYLARTVEPIQIGYYERIAKSAEQYAERLLASHTSSLTGNASEIAHKLVYGYEDHGFVIDKAEAVSVLGEKMVKSNTQEYELGNTVYNIFSRLRDIASAMSHGYYYIGTIETAPSYFKRENK